MATVTKRQRRQPDGTMVVVGYRVRYVDPEGIERSKSFKKGQKAAADDFAADVESAKNRGVYVDTSAGKTTFRAYAENWRQVQGHWRPTTVEQAESRLRLHVYPTIGNRPIGDIRRSELQALLKERALVIAPTTLEVVKAYISAVFQAAVEDRIIAASPAVRLPLPGGRGKRKGKARKRKAVPYTVDEVLALVAALPERWQLVVWLGCGAGLRISEIRGLTVDRVNFLRREITVDRQASLRALDADQHRDPKTDASERVIPVSDDLLGLISEHIRRFPPPPSGLLFSTGGHVVSPSTWSNAWTAAVAGVGLPVGSRFHRMRHSYASALIDEGATVLEVQHAMGHASAQETLETYGHLWPTDDGERRRRGPRKFFARSGQDRSTADAGGSDQG